MKKALSLILALVLCLSLCACSRDTQAQPNDNESTANEGTTNENTDSTQTKVDAEFLSMVCGSWNFYSGWRELGGVLEFRENGTCTINEEELKWDAMFKSKQWLDAPKEFVNIYRNNELVYEAYINLGEDDAITLVISEKDDTGLVPAGTYGKIEIPNHALVQDICGEWKPDADNAPFQSLVIKEDGSCVVDGVSATWKIEGSYTTDTDLSIRVYVDGNILFGMVYQSTMGSAWLTLAMDKTTPNSPMYFADCLINKTQH